MIFQWPSAILCWINSLLPPKIIGGSCGGSTIGGSSQSRLSTGPSESIRSDAAKLRSYYGSGKLVSHRTKTVLRPNESTSIGIDFITRENAHIELPTDARVTLDIVSLQSSGVIIPRDLWGEYIEIGPTESAYGEK